MGQEGGIGERVISENAARQLTYMMNQVVERGTGRRAKLDGWEAAGKTGTTQSARDAWFIGFTADYVTGVWMGYDDNSPLTGVTGGGLPADIWHEVMTRIHAGLPPAPLPMIGPDQVPGATVGNSVPTAPTYAGEIFDATGGAAQPAPQTQDQGSKSLGEILMEILTGGN
jgi:membrane peptidoglycan carboxypeptidase